MKVGRREFAGLGLVSITGRVGATRAEPSLADLKRTANATDQSPDQPETTTLRGRVVCLTEEYARDHKVVADCGHRGHVWSLKVGQRLYPFLPTDSAAAIFLDERFRERELSVAARVFQPASFIEVITIQSWRDGKLYNLGYYCEVCNIWTHKPGACDCCQDPVQFKETLPEGES